MSIELVIYLSLTLFLIVGLWLSFWLQGKRWSSWLDSQQNEKPLTIMSQWLHEMRGSLDRTTDVIQQQLHVTNESIGNRLDNNAQLMRLLNRDLGQIQEIGHQMRDFQLLLKSPKLRGRIGEQILKDILQQILPRSIIKYQHRFLNGHIVDVVISTENGYIPIDAKFPLENFRKASQAENHDQESGYKREFFRDTRRHIDSISQKYILPREGTLDFALMYVPSEAIYYEIITHDTLNTYAQNKNVLIVSSNVLYYFLRVILMGLEGKRVEETTRRIIQSLGALQQEAQNMDQNMKILSKHLNHAKSATDRLMNDYDRMVSKIEEIKFLDNKTKDEI